MLCPGALSVLSGSLALQVSEEYWESLRGRRRKRDTSLQFIITGMQESSVPFLARCYVSVTHLWNAGVTPMQVPRDRPRAVPVARQDGARALRLLFDLEGLFKGFPVCILVLKHSVSQ